MCESVFCDHLEKGDRIELLLGNLHAVLFQNAVSDFNFLTSGFARDTFKAYLFRISNLTLYMQYFSCPVPTCKTPKRKVKRLRPAAS